MSLPTGFVVALAHLHWHPFTGGKRADAIENGKRARLLVFDGHGCSFATSTTLSQGRQQPAAANAYEVEDGDDSCRRSQRRRRVTNTICRHHHKWKMQRRGTHLFVAPSFLFSTQRGGTTSLLTLCSRNQAHMPRFRGRRVVFHHHQPTL